MKEQRNAKRYTSQGTAAPDRVKSYRQKLIYMVSIPENRLMKCLEDDCRVYYDEIAQACPKCGSRAALVVPATGRRGVA